MKEGDYLALQVWMPLNGNLNNQGLSPQTTTVTSTPVWATTGKIGAKSLYTKTRNTTMSFTGLVGVTSYTVAYWLYIPTATAPTAWSDMFGIEFNCGGINRWERDERRAATTTGRHNYHLAKSESEGANTNAYYGTIEDDTANDNWIHVAMVKDNTSARLYFNGSLVHTVAVANFENSPRAMTGAVYLGDSGCEGYLNDFRIYDTALSPREVKEISKGLVLHYPLNRDGFGQDNLIHESANMSTSIWRYGASAALDANEGSGVIKLTGTSANWNASMGTPYNSSNTVNFIPYSTVQNKQVTFSLWIKSNESFDQGITFSLRTSSSSSRTKYFTAGYVAVTTQWQRKSITFTITDASFTGGSGTVSSSDYFFIEVYNHVDNRNVWVKGFKLEFGDKMTPWTPNSSDGVYSKMGLNSTTVYDCSGFGNNGVINDSTLVYSSDTARYSVSTKNSQAADSSTYPLKGNITLNDIDAITISIWAKITVIGKQNSGFLSTSASSTPTDYQTTVMNQYDTKIACTNTSGATVNLSLSNQFILNEWHLYTFVYDGVKAYFYRDGTLITSVAQTGKLKPITGIFPFYSQAGGVHRTQSGYMSDLRVYTTALSANDILELYQIPISLANNGVLLSQILQE